MSVEVETRIDGDPAAPPLLLSNSLGAELEMWDEQIGALSQAFRVLRYNRRGHGRSPAAPGPYSIEDLAGDVIALLDGHEIERASFAGISIGGMVGLWLAINEPERIERLAVCSAAAHLPPPEMWAERAALVRREGTSAVAEATLERWFTPGFRERRAERVDQIRAMLLRTDADAYAACCEALGASDLRDELGAIGAPTLIIRAEQDPSIPAEQAQLLADSIPDARLLTLPEGQHLVNVECPDAVNGPLIEHLARSA
jgi:3-oxoadipate enol-lactonase